MFFVVCLFVVFVCCMFFVVVFVCCMFFVVCLFVCLFIYLFVCLQWYSAKFNDLRKNFVIN